MIENETRIKARPMVAVPSHTWYGCYKSDTKLYWQEQEGEVIREMTASKTSGSYHATSIVEILPLDCFPINFQQIDN